MSYHAVPTDDLSAPYVTCDQCGCSDPVLDRDSLPLAPNRAWLSYGDDGDPDDEGHPLCVGYYVISLPHGTRLEFCCSTCCGRWLERAIAAFVRGTLELPDGAEVVPAQETLAIRLAPALTPPPNKE